MHIKKFEFHCAQTPRIYNIIYKNINKIDFWDLKNIYVDKNMMI